MHTITVKSDKPMVVIPVDDYENMKETIDLLASNPELLQELKAERSKIEKGDYISLEDFKSTYKVQ
ncbi:hypothetical protein LR066_02800 [candidate division WOR-3 bacterium]|nr:hypothetical protein [candidate division WOR-3 bacterium]